MMSCAGADSVCRAGTTTSSAWASASPSPSLAALRRWRGALRGYCSTSSDVVTDGCTHSTTPGASSAKNTLAWRACPTHPSGSEADAGSLKLRGTSGTTTASESSAAAPGMTCSLRGPSARLSCCSTALDE
jgi:hypothetical protein